MPEEKCVEIFLLSHKGESEREKKKRGDNNGRLVNIKA